MPDGNRLLYEQLKKDKLYTKSYPEFVKQFATPEKQAALHRVMQLDKVYSKPIEAFSENFFPQVWPTTNPRDQNKTPSYKYQGTRGYVEQDRQTLLENMELENKFKEKYQDKDLWTRYAYLNQDENLKDMIVSNENKVDPYLLASTVSGEGMVDELHGRAQGDSSFTINEYQPPTISTGEGVITGTTWYGLDDFAGRYDEFKKKGLTSLEPYKEGGKPDKSKLDKYFIPSPFIQETGKETMAADFMSPKAGLDATSTYLKNIQNMVESAGVKGTPEEKEFLIHVGYNHGEGGLRSYLKKSKNAKDIIERLKKEKPQVYKNAQQRVIVSKELRESKSFERK